MSKTIDLDSPAVQSYLTILQSVIGRMASNSAGAKAWCVALVSAIIVVVAGKGEPGYVWIALVPVGLFFLLDAYYLGLEREFRERYNGFIRKLHDRTAEVEDLFIVASSDDLSTTLKNVLTAGQSVSVWPFYSVLGLMLLAVWMLIP